MLSPFFGRDAVNTSDPLHGRFDEYNRVAREIFEPSDMQTADIAILPFDFGMVLIGKKPLEQALSFIARVEQSKKKTIVFCWSDSSEDLPLPEKSTLVFRTALDLNRKKHNEHCMPSFNEDFVSKYLLNTLPIRKKYKVPIVSFCGRCSPNLDLASTTKNNLRKIRDILRCKPMQFPYLSIRRRALNTLYETPGLGTSFITFDSFWGGLGDDAGNASAFARLQARRQFVENMTNSDYVLCVRGAGNFSMRIYETLCMGRIPLIIDSESAYPFPNQIDWNSLGPVVALKNIRNLGSVLLDYHSRLTEDHFAFRQENNRRVWQKYLSPHGFFRNLREHLLTLR